MKPASSAPPSGRRSAQQALLDAARAFEADVVIPWCPSCTRPCCGLSDVVLELSFPQVQRLYAIGSTAKKTFDRALPPSIKRKDDRYYAHGEPCPAYDGPDKGGSKKCRVYDTDAKPQSCSDFPVYDDGDVVTADLRCEAVRAGFPRLVDALRAVAGDDLVQERDTDWPDTFVSFAVSTKAKAKKRR